MLRRNENEWIMSDMKQHPYLEGKNENEIAGKGNEDAAL